MPIDIRDLSEGPVDEIVAVLDAVDPGHRAPVAPECFAGDHATFLLAARAPSGDGPVWVGLAWGAHVRYPTGHRMTYLHQLDVIASHRRRGIATALVEASMELARRSGSGRFWLSTGGHNQVALALYERLGGDRKEAGDVNFWWQLD